jgi:hypothetical protein
MRAHLWYKLDGHTPVPCESIDEANIRKNDEWRVDQTHLRTGEFISTVFLGLDHSWEPTGPPILFETMIFRGPLDQWQERYCTWDEAEIGHEVAVRLAKRARWNPLAWWRAWRKR